MSRWDIQWLVDTNRKASAGISLNGLKSLVFFKVFLQSIFSILRSKQILNDFFFCHRNHHEYENMKFVFIQQECKTDREIKKSSQAYCCSKRVKTSFSHFMGDARNEQSRNVHASRSGESFTDGRSLSGPCDVTPPEWPCKAIFPLDNIFPSCWKWPQGSRCHGCTLQHLSSLQDMLWG